MAIPEKTLEKPLKSDDIGEPVDSIEVDPETFLFEDDDEDDDVSGLPPERESSDDDDEDSYAFDDDDDW